mmetsp:Transcript_6123/g.12844  ORF Transcript_6123/g.12844 Transcript_6123/m.12844 type:complete len:158 (+) Transcript_6123:35-508(+)
MMYRLKRIFTIASASTLCTTLLLPKSALTFSVNFSSSPKSPCFRSYYFGSTISSSLLMNRRGGGGRSATGGPRRPRRPRAPPPPEPSPGQPGRGCFRKLIVVGNEVWVVKKNDQRTGVETKGTVMRHLTNSPYHPRGIKVMLTSGEVGRVTRFVADE